MIWLAGIAVSVATLVVAVAWARSQARAAFDDEAKRFRDVRPVFRGILGGVGLVSARGIAPVVRVLSMSGGDDLPQRWECAGLVPRLGARTTFHVEPKGDRRAQAKFGRKLVELGDAAFDGVFALSGEDHDLLRAVFSSVAVQDALRRMFLDQPFAFAQIDDEGRLLAAAPIYERTAAEARDRLLRTQELVRALHDNASVRALPAQGAALSVEGVGGASGAPVSVPIGSKQ
jgi:hypothetical protein